MTIAKLRSPIVLVHGLFGFDRLQVAGATLASYFPGIPELLQAVGNRVFVPSLTPTGGVEQRAAELRDFIDRTSPGEPVHLISHSMGGLDSRYMISRLGMAGRVLSLTTLGTPHRGSSFADWGVDKFERFVKPLLEMVGVPSQAFYDLRRENCKAFNEKVPDDPNVRYFSVAGRHDGHFRSPEWIVPYRIVMQMEGDNDGIVSVESARYGEHLDIWEGNHLSMVNWFSRHDPVPRYGGIVGRLADIGF